MKTATRQVYTAECQREAVRLVTHQGDGVSEAAHHLGIKTQRLGRWIRQAEAQEHGARADHGRLSRAQEERERWRQEHTRLRMEGDIFNTPVSFLASAAS